MIPLLLSRILIWLGFPYQGHEEECKQEGQCILTLWYDSGGWSESGLLQERTWDRQGLSHSELCTLLTWKVNSLLGLTNQSLSIYWGPTMCQTVCNVLWTQRVIKDNIPWVNRWLGHHPSSQLCIQWHCDDIRSMPWEHQVGCSAQLWRRSER